MDVLLLGNGFDLYHYLPTKYINFMHTMQFLIEAGDVSNFQTVGQVFSDSCLQAKDRFIAQCYLNNKTVFDNTCIDSSVLTDMVNAARSNSWFCWFDNCCTKDIGWVDFEKEIAHIVGALDEKMADCTNVYISGKSIHADIYTALSFFNDIVSENHGIGGGYVFTEKCTNDIDPGLRIRYIDREKVAGMLFQSLLDFKRIFEQYLIAFIEKPIKNAPASALKSTLKMFTGADIVATYNYTKMHEFLYNSTQQVVHIHGDLSNNTVLGISSDEHDELNFVDTTFIAFKKYFQRVKSNIDTEFIKIIELLHSSSSYEEGELFIVGHSLDATDKDTLMEFISESKHVFIYYHSDNALGTYIANMIKMYGKEEFERMRRVGKLYFVDLPPISVNGENL